MESVLTPLPNGDDWSDPQLEPTHVPTEEPMSDAPTSDEPVDELPPEREADEEAEQDDATADPDHESAPPPETDPAMTFADLKLIRPLMDAIDAAGYEH